MSFGFADILCAGSQCLNIGSFLFRSMFWLRLGVLTSTIGFVTFSCILGNGSMIVWNSVFIGVNAYQLVRLIIVSRNCSRFENASSRT